MGRSERKRSIKKTVIISAAAGLLVLCLAVMITVHVLLKQNFSRGEYSEYSVSYRYSHYEDGYPRTPVSFRSGKNTLRGYIYGGDNDKGLIVVSHGIGGGHEGYINEIVWFTEHGWRVFAYDCTGSCESEGEGTKGLPQSALDLDAALTYIEQDNSLSGMKKYLYGHSWGGYAVTAGLNFDHDVTASASIAGYAYPMEMIMEVTDGMIGGASKLLYPFIWLDCKAAFGEYSNLSAIDGINKSGIPVLIVHGEDDELIGYGRSSIISKKAEITNPNVEYYTVSGANDGHNSIFQSPEAAEYKNELEKDYEKLKERYGKKIPGEVQQEFYDGADKEKANECNTELLEKINTFFEKAS